MPSNMSNSNDSYYEDIDDLQLAPAALTDTGCEREVNEDRYGIFESDSGLGWFVLDGMGGATGGELAASLALESIKRNLDVNGERPVEAAMKEALTEANKVISARRQNPAFSSMGTTAIGILIKDNELSLGYVGDSRAYLIRDGAIQQLSKDHTLVQELVDRGDIHPEAALSHPKAHVLTKAIGSDINIDIPVKKFWLWETETEESTADRIVLCSDGLYSLVNEGEIATSVSEKTPQDSCIELVSLAKERGGFDNITIAIIPLPGILKQEPYKGKSKVNASASNTLKQKEVMSLLGLSLISFICTLSAIGIAVLSVLMMLKN